MGESIWNRPFKNSCNVYFYTVARRLSLEKMVPWVQSFSLGVKTGVDVPGERAGTLPSPSGGLTDTLTAAIGQGKVTVTPLQVASAMAVLSQGGTWYSPHLRYGPASHSRKIPIDSANLEAIRNGMKRVVTQGTARRAAVKGLDVFGKTGTAQVVAKSATVRQDQLPWEQRDHAWFAGYAGHISFAIIVEHSGHGGVSAAPIARKGILYLQKEGLL